MNKLTPEHIDAENLRGTVQLNGKPNKSDALTRLSLENLSKEEKTSLLNVIANPQIGD